MALKRIKRELEKAEDYPLRGVTIQKNEQNWFNHQGWITGPEGTVYEGGLYQIEVNLPQDYPFKPPKLRFVNKVYHPNINEKGHISCCHLYC